MPRDGKYIGRLMVWGPWIISGYYAEEKPLLEDGWFNTGDVANMGRTTKSGSPTAQRTSSSHAVNGLIDIENLAMGCLGVVEAASYPGGAAVACRCGCRRRDEAIDLGAS